MKTVYQCIAVVIATIFVYGVLVLMFPPKARAEAVRFDCGQLAGAIGTAAQLRDVGADVDKVLAMARRRGAVDGARLEVLERELRRVWKNRRLTPDDAAIEVFTRCNQQMGDMGRQS